MVEHTGTGGSPEKRTEPSLEVLEQVTDADVEDFQRLLPQMTENKAPNHETLRARLQAVADPENPDTRLLVVRDEEGRIQATATGTIRRKPTGANGWVDDVVTDEAHRGQGFGEALMEELHTWFVANGIGWIGLTSHSSRAAAGRLYERLGYAEWPTRLYRLQIDMGAQATKMS